MPDLSPFQQKFAATAAVEITENHKDRLDTCDYKIVGFVQAAAELAILNPGIARLIGERMAPPKSPEDMHVRGQ